MLNPARHREASEAKSDTISLSLFDLHTKWALISHSNNQIPTGAAAQSVQTNWTLALSAPLQGTMIYTGYRFDRLLANLESSTDSCSEKK